MNDTPTPRTDEATLLATDLEQGGNFNAVHVQVAQRLEEELAAVTEQRDGLRSGIDCASDQLTRVTEQRDRLAEALRKIKNAGGTHNDPYDELDFIDGITYETLQSLDQPTKP